MVNDYNIRQQLCGIFLGLFLPSILLLYTNLPPGKPYDLLPVFGTQGPEDMVRDRGNSL